jgi:NAD(P)-dependent dehydrogenase (short-subunit alcohol dehydrogenase family)
LQAQFQDRVTVVTGGASGIGEGIVRRVVTEGGRCVVADLQVERAESIADEPGRAATAVRAVERFGRLDATFNNAGAFGADGSIFDHTLETWSRTMDVLLTSVVLGTCEAARVVIPQGRGAIANTASTAGVPGESASRSFDLAGELVGPAVRRTGAGA